MRPDVDRCRASAEHTGDQHQRADAELDTDSSMPGRLTARAAGRACNIRHAPVRSGTNTSAPHGGG